MSDVLIKDIFEYYSSKKIKLIFISLFSIKLNFAKFIYFS
jgi:hypothetical protein